MHLCRGTLSQTRSFPYSGTLQCRSRVLLVAFTFLFQERQCDKQYFLMSVMNSLCNTECLFLHLCLATQIKERRTRYYSGSNASVDEPRGRNSATCVTVFYQPPPILSAKSREQNLLELKISFTDKILSLIFHMGQRNYFMAIDSTSVLALFRSTLSEKQRRDIDQWESLKPLGPRSFPTQASSGYF